MATRIYLELFEKRILRHLIRSRPESIDSELRIEREFVSCTYPCALKRYYHTRSLKTCNMPLAHICK